MEYETFQDVAASLPRFGYLLTSNPADQSTASEFFTGDYGTATHSAALLLCIPSKK
jgi:hypothetical protein